MSVSLVVYTSILVWSAPVVNCEPSSTTGIRYMYFIDKFKANWITAKSKCEAEGGNLAEDIDIDDWELTYGRSNYFLNDLYYWIGLSRQPPTWKWVGGKSLDLNDTASFPLRKEYEANITWNCVQWNVKEPFYVPQACNVTAPFICKTNKSFNCDFLQKGSKTVDATNIKEYSNENELRKDKGNISSPSYFIHHNVETTACKQHCQDFNTSLGVQCWMYEYHHIRTCRLVLSQGKPILLDLKDTTGVTLYSKYCVEVEKYTGCEFGEECICGNVTAPPDQEELEKIVKETQKKLKVSKKNLSATIRKFNSATDDRPSSQAMGVLGIFLISFTLGGIILLDCSSLVTDFKWMLHNLHYMSRNNKESSA